MAEWVLKGSLKGPQGDPGQDAQLPAGGTEGQVLTKTSDGEAWQDVPETDMTGMATFKSVMDTFAIARVGEGGQEEFVPQFLVVPSDYDPSSDVPPTNYLIIGLSRGGPIIIMSGKSPSLRFGDKIISAITDDASSGSSTALATAMAVKDYADSVGVPAGGTAGQVLTKMEDGEAWADANSSGISVVQAESKYGTLTLDKGMKLYGVVWIDDMDNTALSGLYTESTLETIISSNINIGVGVSTVDISDNGSEFVVRSSSARVIDFYGIE